MNLDLLILTKYAIINSWEGSVDPKSLAEAALYLAVQDKCSHAADPRAWEPALLQKLDPLRLVGAPAFTKPEAGLRL